MFPRLPQAGSGGGHGWGGCQGTQSVFVCGFGQDSVNCLPRTVLAVQRLYRQVINVNFTTHREGRGRDSAGEMHSGSLSFAAIWLCLQMTVFFGLNVASPPQKLAMAVTAGQAPQKPGFGCG